MLFKNTAFCIGVILALVVTVFSTLLQVFLRLLPAIIAFLIGYYALVLIFG